jgi:hypothetical protein
MNNFSGMTVVVWETRNWRHRAKAVMWCKDFGLKHVAKNVCIGNLYVRECRELRSRFQNLFNNKTEQFLLLTLCMSCASANSSSLPAHIKNIFSVSNFELIQMP